MSESAQDLARRLAGDADLWCHTFMPGVFRQAPPSFSKTAWQFLEQKSDKVFRLMMMPRGFSKTTRLRASALRRICHRVARVIPIIGKTINAARDSVTFIRDEIERNAELREFYGIMPSDRKWTEGEIRIEFHDGGYALVKAYGIEGSVRGMNIDGHRPDLIILDDIIDEENSATPELRAKLADKIFSAVKDSLTPRTENPMATIIGAVTPQNADDFAHLAMKDPECAVMRLSCWTPQTEDLNVEEQESSWPARFPSETLRREKKSAIARGMYHVFAREKECRIVSREGAVLRAEWLRFWDREERHPEGGATVIAIDPTPPPTERELARGLITKDYTAIAAVTRVGNDLFLREYHQKKGMLPTEIVVRAMDMAVKYGAIKIVIETQGGGSFIVEEARRLMTERGRFFMIDEFSKRESKFEHIVGTLGGLAQSGRLFCRSDMADFMQQFSEYPNVANDDLIDAVAIGVRGLKTYGADGSVGMLPYDEDEFGPTPVITVAP